MEVLFVVIGNVGSNAGLHYGLHGVERNCGNIGKPLARQKPMLNWASLSIAVKKTVVPMSSLPVLEK